MLLPFAYVFYFVKYESTMERNLLMINIKKSHRQVLWDTCLIDEDKTTAKLVMHHPQKREICMVNDEIWEDRACGYGNIFKDGDIYRMYYLAIQNKVEINTDSTETAKLYACYAESTDGIMWKKPNLGIYAPYEGMYDNNIVMDDTYGQLDNFFVMKDANPLCPPEEKYKAVVRRKTGKPGMADDELWCYVSSDALHFKEGWLMRNKNAFDSLNTAMWDETAGVYRCWYRGFHDWPGEIVTIGTRDIRYMESKDFKNWTEERRIDINSPYDFQMYTNNVMKYYRDSSIFIGLPTRYTERTEWTDNYEQLCGKENRKIRIKNLEPREGLALTDCMFMTSRDGVTWERFDEAFLDAGPEQNDNWIYGDAYLSYGIIETESDNCEPELSLYAFEGRWSYRPAKLRRYTIRLDGFASYNAPYSGGRLVTKPFTFEGDELEINFRTSAAGGIYVNILDEKGEAIEGYTSCEIFGNTVSRKINFEKSLKELNSKVIRLEFIMSDADVYSFVIN